MDKHLIYVGGMFESRKSALSLYIQQGLNEWCNVVTISLNKQLGSRSFYAEIGRIEKIIERHKPEMIVAHSLGAYIAANLGVNCPLVFLEPSLRITDIVLPNVEDNRYFDGIHTFDLSQEFIESLKTCPSIENVSKKLRTGENVFIFGAGRGGFKIAELYKENITGCHYFFLPEADHNFSEELDRQKILDLIKKRLDLMSPSRGGCTHRDSVRLEDR